MNNTTQAPIILIELDQETRSKHLDRAKAWFDNVLLTQASNRKLLEDTVEKIEEPHIKQYLTEMVEQEKKHEEKARELFSLIDREPSDVRQLLGEVMGKARQALGDFIAVAGGAKGPWQDLHQVYLSNYNSLGAFAVAEQLGLALGIPRIAEITFGVMAEKSTSQLLLQECVLEMSSMSILYKEDF
ncbi:hypothetical protein ACFSKU_05420 [Pontibacter silvestris]|uniref:Ferritin-like metal-binding protein YciE n=1 Tax=Pontibacter silvestris TaxID=2305183 RepID=A0ABW4WX23_9BACT|nr:hypothetical protein [Pontibacter silvestris]MCC9136976.1 hypothetical protein [Pontibacter silvestris]